MMFIIMALYMGIPLLIFIGIIALIKSLIKKANQSYFKSNIIDNNTYKSNVKKNIYKDITKDKLAIFNTDDISSLKDYFYDIFLKFENAYNDLDYNTMKIISTSQLYENYYTGMSLDAKENKKRIIKDIKRKNVILYEVDSTTIKQTAGLLIEISDIDYKIDKNGYIIKGNKDTPLTEKFEVQFRKDFDKEDIKKCHNCGAQIEGKRCSYCRTLLKNNEFRISSIKKIIE